MGRGVLPEGPTFRHSDLVSIHPLYFHTLPNSFALFCTCQKFNAFIFKQFRTLCEKHPGVGYPRGSYALPPCSPANLTFYPFSHWPELANRPGRLFQRFRFNLQPWIEDPDPVGTINLLCAALPRSRNTPVTLPSPRSPVLSSNPNEGYSAITEERCDELHLPLMSPINTSVHGTAFCEAIDARLGVTTGISASDRAITILAAIDPKTKPQDLARPGHIFPLRARNGGVLVRAGQTEASVDLARIAGLTPAGVICEIMNEDGTMARVPQLVEFCKQHNLRMLTVADLIRYRMQHERYVRRVAEAVLPTRYGEFRMIAYSSDVDHDQHVALARGDLEAGTAPLVRVHSHCLTGDVFGSITCDCAELVARSLEAIAKEDRGVFL